MGKLSTTTLHDVQDALFGGQALTIPVSHRIVLSTTEPQDDGSGITEPTENGYAPVVVDNDLTTWAVAADRSKTNAITIAFPEVTDSDSDDGWGDLGWFAVLDDDTDVMQGHGRLGTVLSPQVGDEVVFEPDDLVVGGPPS